MEVEEHTPCFKTSDFVTVVVLILRRHELLHVIYDNPKRVVFEFTQTRRLEADFEDLRLGKLLVEPTDFWSAARRTKQLIYEKGERYVV